MEATPLGEVPGGGTPGPGPAAAGVSAAKVTVTWSEDVADAVAGALRGSRSVTALRIEPEVPDDPEDGFWDDESGFDEDGNLLPLPPHEAGALADLDLGGLRELDLSYFRIGDPGATSLAAAASAGLIETLDLRYCGIGDEGAAVLAASANFAGVRRLRLQHNRLTGEGVRALARLARIEELDLRYNRIGEEGARALAEAAFAGSLKRLLLHRQDVTDAGVRILASAPRFPTVLRSFWRSV
ncbi:hypothetical protein ABZ354_05850 [Streptomyces sp. NPDC005925]|uniref:hypothetical protein n=1 Tax=Streptomyces sp. NPDC005925 TaxID=3157172 RepID=UPI0033C2D98F